MTFPAFADLSGGTEACRAAGLWRVVGKECTDTASRSVVEVMKWC